MKLVAFLADAAQADPQGKLHALGVGWTTLPTPTSPLAVVALADFSADETPIDASVTFELLDANEDPRRAPPGA